MTWGFEVLVQLVMAATTTSPSARRWCGADLGSSVGGARGPVQRHPEGVARTGEGDPVLGPGRPGQRGLDVAQVERGVFGVDGLDAVGGVPQPLLLGVGLHQGEVRPRRDR